MIGGVATLGRIFGVLERADNWLLDRCERFCHWSQRTVGLDSAFWGRGCLIYSAVECTFDMIKRHSKWMLPLYIIVMLWHVGLFIKFGNKRPKIGEAVTANEHKYTLTGGRRFMMLCLPPNILVSIIELKPSVGAAFTAILYLLAVDDLPSRPSKLRVWWESLLSNPIPEGGSTRNQQ